MSTVASHLSFEMQGKIHEALAETTTKFLGDDSVLNALEHDPLNHPSQSLDIVQLSAIPTDPKTAEELITLASPRLFPYLKDQFLERENHTRQLHKINNRYTASGNVVHLNIHQTIEDIIALMVARSLATYELVEDISWHGIVRNNFTMISRGIATLSAFGYAAPEAVRQGGEVFLSFPRSDTITKLAKEIVLPEGVTMDKIIDDNNERVRQAIDDFMPGVRDIEATPLPHPVQKRNGYIATSGSTDLVEGDPERPDHISLLAASPALVKTLGGASVAPTVTWDRGKDKEPILITGELTTLKKVSDLQRVQEWHRSTLARALGIPDDAVTIRQHSRN